MHASELAPALRFSLHPAARLLLMTGTAAASESARFARIKEVATELGHLVETEANYATFESTVPDAVILDGSSAATPDLIREMRALTELEKVPFIALISGQLSDEMLNELGRAGVVTFIDIEASSVDIVSRLQSALELSRARTEVISLREQLTRQVRVDDVTGVMTRRFFFQQAHRECARARRYGHPLSCLMVEVDHYPKLCVIFSNSTGEAVLRAVATTLGQWTRDSDIIARFSDSKFVILLPETDLDGATGAREKILRALRENSWRFDDRVLPVSVSIGESQLTKSSAPIAGNEPTSEGDDMDETALSTREAMAGLLEDADAALYIARKGARVPDVFVPYTPAPDHRLTLASQG